MERTLTGAWAASRPRDLTVSLVTAGCLALLALFVLYPVLLILGRSLTSEGDMSLAGYREFFGNWRLFRTLLQSLLVSGLSTVITVALGFALAYTVTRTTIPAKGFISTMALVPLIAPPFVVSLAFILLLGRNGLLTARWFDLGWDIYGWPGIVLTQVFSFLPQAYLLLAGVLASVDSSLEEAAENLGASRWLTLRKVILAVARPGLASAFLIVFILCMTDFGNPILIGGRFSVLATEIYNQITGLQDFAMASTLSVMLTLPCLAAYAANQLWVGGKSYVTLKGGTSTAIRPTPALARWGMFAFAFGTALTIVVVYGTIVLGSFFRVWGYDWRLTLSHYDFKTVGGGEVIWNSLKMSLAAALAGAALSVVIAYLVERKRPLGRKALEISALLPAALPGTVMGVGYLLAFNSPPLVLAGGLGILVASVLFLNVSVGVLAGTAALKQVDPAIEEAATSLGASSAYTFFRVMLPLMKTAFVSALVYIFIRGMVTISAVIFLVSPGYNLASVSILNQVEAGRLGAAAALSTLLLAFVLGAVALLRVAARKERVAIFSA